jgi:hypothetical protein
VRSNVAIYLGCAIRGHRRPRSAKHNLTIGHPSAYGFPEGNAEPPLLTTQHFDLGLLHELGFDSRATAGLGSQRHVVVKDETDSVVVVIRIGTGPCLSEK